VYRRRDVRITLREQGRDLRRHLFDVTKTHADVKPVQDTSWRRSNGFLHDGSQAVRTISKNRHFGVGRPAIVFERSLHKFHSICRPLSDPSKSMYKSRLAPAFSGSRARLIMKGEKSSFESKTTNPH
jgi:hypothetical protein